MKDAAVALAAAVAMFKEFPFPPELGYEWHYVTGGYWVGIQRPYRPGEHLHPEAVRLKKELLFVLLGGHVQCPCGYVMREDNGAEPRRELAQFGTDIRGAMTYMRNLVLLGEVD